MGTFFLIIALLFVCASALVLSYALDQRGGDYTVGERRVTSRVGKVGIVLFCMAFVPFALLLHTALRCIGRKGTVSKSADGRYSIKLGRESFRKDAVS